MKPGFNLVPLRETHGFHPVRNARKQWASRRRCQFIRRHVDGMLVNTDRALFANPMEVQAKLLIQSIWRDMCVNRECDSDTWNLRSL